MRAIRVRRHLDSQVLDIPELADLIGTTVDIIVLAEPATENGAPNLSALDALAGQDVIDEAAFEALRRASAV